MKVSVVISLCDNRFSYFNRALDTWNNQTEKDFELVLIDDGNRQDIRELCNNYPNLNFQYIQIDNSKCDVPITTFTPVLSNNVGMRMARSNIVCITGPETLQNKNNIKVASSFINRKQCGYGLVYKSNSIFIDIINKNWNKSFDGLLKLPGAKNNCLTRPPHPPAYYYFCVVKKEYVEKIGGIDERFGEGFCAEDDDFSNRMKMFGVTPVFEHNIIGIHQDHSNLNTKKHILRYTEKEMRDKNLLLMRENLKNYNYIANTDHIWGDPKVIISHEIF